MAAPPRPAVLDLIGNTPLVPVAGCGLPALRRVLVSGLVSIIADASGFDGLITRFDLLNPLRKASR